MRPGARIKGDITCTSLAVHKGCELEGSIKMLEGALHRFEVKRNKVEDDS